MPKVSKFTDEQKVEIALDLLSGKLSHATKILMAMAASTEIKNTMYVWTGFIRLNDAIMF